MPSIVPSVERLEDRIAPAGVTVTAATKTATWTDFDGDLVTLKWTGANTPEFFSHTPANTVTGGVTVDRINLGSENDAVTLTVKRGPLGGDGHVDVGYVDALGVVMKSFIAPHVGVLEFDAGDQTNAIGTLSLGSYGILQALAFSTPGGNAVGLLDGSVGSVKIAGDLGYGKLTVGHNPSSQIGSVTVNGSVNGAVNTATGFNGYLEVWGTAGAVKIGGSVIGGAGASSGTVLIHNSATSLTIGGDVIGGGANNAGAISGGTVTAVTIGGSVVGGSGGATGNLDLSKVKTLVIGGDIQGGSQGNSGNVVVGFSGNPTSSIVIKGSIIGGVALNPGSSAGNEDVGALLAYGDVGSITIGRNVVAGSTVDTDSTTNHVERNGAILVNGTLGALTIGGSILGNNTTHVFITAEGTTPATAGSFNGLGKLTVKGSVTFGVIATGQSFLTSFTTNMGAAENPDAGIGNVTIGGNYEHSNIMAGSNDVGSVGVNSVDTQSLGAADRIARLGVVTIKGAVLDDTSATGDSGFEAETIAKIVVGGITVFTHATPAGTDHVTYLDPFHFVLAQEILA